MEKELARTDWFPWDVKPFRHGWYEVEVLGVSGPTMAYWSVVDGRWNDTDALGSLCLIGVLRWRGLAEPYVAPEPAPDPGPVAEMPEKRVNIPALVGAALITLLIAGMAVMGMAGR
jgi:hypothetical protein